MRVVMPSVVPHTGEEKCMPLGRCEWGSGKGNPHIHGMVYAAWNLGLSWEHEAMVLEEDKEGARAEGERERQDGGGALRPEAGVDADGEGGRFCVGGGRELGKWCGR